MSAIVCTSGDERDDSIEYQGETKIGKEREGRERERERGRIIILLSRG